MNLEVNMRRPHLARSCSISSRLHGPEAVCAVTARQHLGKAEKVRVCWRRAAIVRMRVPTEAVSLPDNDSCASERVSGLIEDAACDFYDFSLRGPCRAIDNGKVVC
jgi:hypothetical protein